MKINEACEIVFRHLLGKRSYEVTLKGGDILVCTISPGINLIDPLNPSNIVAVNIDDKVLNIHACIHLATSVDIDEINGKSTIKASITKCSLQAYDGLMPLFASDIGHDLQIKAAYAKQVIIGIAEFYVNEDGVKEIGREKLQRNTEASIVKALVERGGTH